jgi:two-component system, NtrC family, response regulator AtoC
MPRLNVMVVDDEEDMRDYVQHLLSSLGYDVLCFPSGDAALRAVAKGYSPAIAIVDVTMPGADGLEVLQRLKAMCPPMVVMMLSAASHPDTVVAAGRFGATRYLTKPILADAMKRAVDEAVDAHRVAEKVQGLERALARAQRAGEMITNDPATVRLHEVARTVADTDVPVLITGESGVGKELLARFLHEHSRRRGRTFVKVNCAALPHELLESELFGHEKGAFTGAIADRPGRFELADGGTIFLDEIAEMSPQLQAKLLHVLQDGEFCRVGGKPMKVNARVVAATNKDLETAIRNKEFRVDLYYRLNVVRMMIPPLRSRRPDIELLLQHFLKRYALEYRRSCAALPPELLRAFLEHEWPGNIRELENAVKRHVILQDVGVSLEELTRSSRNGGAPAGARPAAVTAPLPRSLKEAGKLAAENVEKMLILRALDATAWNRKSAARDLNMCYKALLNKLKRWGLDQPSARLRPAALDDNGGLDPAPLPHRF